MAGEPLTRKIHIPLEKVVSADFNAQQDQAHRGLLDTLRHLFARGVDHVAAGRNTAQFVTGFVGNSFKLYPASPGFSMNVRLAPGIGFQDSAGLSNPMPGDGYAWRVNDYNTYGGVNDYGYGKPLYLETYAEITVPAAPSGAEGEYRYDLVEVRCGRRQTDGAIPDIFMLNTSTGVYEQGDDGIHLKSLRFDLDGDVGTVNAPAASTNRVSLKKGSDVSSNPTRPSVTAGYVAVAYVRVGVSTTTIDYDRILDARTLVFPGGQSSGFLSFTFTSPAGTAPTGYSFYAPPGVEVYVVADAAELGTVWVYLLGTFNANLVVTSGSGTQYCFTVEKAVIELDDSIADVSAINSARNAVGAVQTAFGQLAVRFKVHVVQIDQVGTPGIQIPISGAVDVHCLFGLWS